MSFKSNIILRQNWAAFRLSILWIYLWTSAAFNLEPESYHSWDGLSSLDEFRWGRPSYFGYSVALHQNPSDNSAWVVVGAPRANSSLFVPNEIPEAGAIFKCSLQNVDVPCQELRIDQDTGEKEAKVGERHQDHKARGWLGASLDSQTNSDHITAVCAPRWKNRLYKDYQMNGACYWLNESLPDAVAHKELPLIDVTKQATSGVGNVFNYKYGQAGVSLHFPDDSSQMIIGAPGVLNWKGSVIRLSDGDSRFSDQQVFNPGSDSRIDSYSMMGYSVTSGNFFSRDELLYASGAPRAADLHGKVFVFTFLEDDKIAIHDTRLGTLQGEGFGSSLVSADVNGDGLDDLVIGCPSYYDGTIADIGRIQLFIGQKDNYMQDEGFRYGRDISKGRFGTTLAALGDLNRDRFEDVAIGAPWEDDGRGSVYIYLGDKSGLRQEFSQRLSPEDFPGVLDLHGFGMGISRGIDVDHSGYPDLAIGSFISGHVLFIKSRSVASLQVSVSTKPQALTVETSSFELKTCFTYDGYNVTDTAEISGNFSLDDEYPSPRATFSRTDTARKNISESLRAGEEPTCLDYTVNVKTENLDPSRPIVVRVEHFLVDIPGQRMSLAITDTAEMRVTRHPIGIATGCEEDGNETCTTDMKITAAFENYGDDDKLTIGSKNTPKLDITVENGGEPLFLPNVTVQVTEPFALFMPTSHRCVFRTRGNRSVLTCALSNPIKTGQQDTVQVTIDARNVEDTSTNELKINVKAEGDGVDIDDSDNALSKRLQLVASADLELNGYSDEEQIFYGRIGEDVINATIPRQTFTHVYKVVKSGETPLGKVGLEIDVPIAFAEEDDDTFITLYPPQTNFKKQPFPCTVEGSSWAVGNPRLSSMKAMNDTITPRSSANNIFFSNGSSSDSGMTEKQMFTCANGQVICAKVRCQINSWPGGMHSAELSLTMAVDLPVLASRISAKYGAAVGSTATATILSIREDTSFVGNKIAEGSIDTDILPDSMAGKGVPWWVILLAVLGSLLLLALIVFLMYKCGFFERKERNEMREHRALVVRDETSVP